LPDQAKVLGFPLLVRPSGSHGGEAIVKLDGPVQLAGFLPFRDDELYVTRFVDFRSSDGHYRKYRVVFVDGVMFPYHLAISEDWLIHYFRTDMANRPDFREEEQRFLETFLGYLGPVAVTALAEIGRRVDLDFFGIDFGLMPSGELVLFECNATMLVRHIDEPAIYDYRKPAAERIRDAVTRLVTKRANFV